MDDDDIPQWQGLGEIMAGEIDRPTLTRTRDHLMIHARCLGCGRKQGFGEAWTVVEQALRNQCQWDPLRESCGVVLDTVTGRVMFHITLLCNCGRPGSKIVVQEEAGRVAAMLNAAGRAR